MSAPLPQVAVGTGAGLRMIVTLGLIAMLSGLAVVLVFDWTRPVIAENQRRATEQAVFRVLPGAVRRADLRLGADGFGSAQDAAAGELVYAGYAADGRLVGLALSSAAQGYQDLVQLLYGYDPACQCVRGIRILKMTETPGLGDRIAFDPAFLANFEALDASLDLDGEDLANPIRAVKHGHKRDRWEVDAISGATISSVAVANAINRSVRRMAPLIQRHRTALEEAGQ